MTRKKPTIRTIDWSNHRINELRNEIKQKQKELDELIFEEFKILNEMYMWKKK